MNLEWKRKPCPETGTRRDGVVLRERNGVPYLAFPALEESGIVSHAFSTRLGGVSEGKFATMNLTFTRGDRPEHVMENYRRMAAALEVDAERMVLSWQTHTANIRKVVEEDAGKGITKERDYQDVDGLITNVPGITLVTFYADCVPLYLVDPVKRAVGLVHSGWKGTVKRIGQAAVDAMGREYGTRPEDLIVCIGPSICQDCFEVGEEVVREFREAFDPSYHTELSYKKGSGKHQLNLWRANQIIFEEAGVRRENIHTTDICTHCNPEYLFSHRTTGNERGNLAAFLCLK